MSQRDLDNNQLYKTLKELMYAGDKLEEEICNLQHELRRIGDGIESVGGSSHAMEKKAKQLLNNIDLCKSDLKANQMQQEKVSKQISSTKH